MLSEQEKACTDKIAQLEESLKKKKQAAGAADKQLQMTLSSFCKSRDAYDFLSPGNSNASPPLYRKLTQT
ncbi:hypothetical protein L1049_010731 [Liquidambar formosana]|uniref:Uncharacterized protein n=1 Tax=Liquidambar formosana TaxID=63359 RepID=A0AAP0R532_LIQFO